MQIHELRCRMLRKFFERLTKAVAVGLILGIASCGGGNTGGSTGGGAGVYTIGGRVSGLASGASIVIQRKTPASGMAQAASVGIQSSNSVVSDSITASTNGTFTFSSPVSDLSAYETTIVSPPAGEACAVTYGSDMVRSADVANINVFCGPIPTGVFATGADPGIVRNSHTATSLANGTVLVAGGMSINSLLAGGDFFQKSAELYDPVSDSWTPTGNLAAPRYNHTATLLPNGKVLVVGGYDNPVYLSSAELYDPSAGTWSSAGNMSVARLYHSATLLRNGKVLVVGGTDGPGMSAGAEIYDPETNSWSAAANPLTQRFVHSATLLENGMVLVAGGATGTPVLASAELYDPDSDTWSATGNLISGRAYHSANLLPDGKVLVAGGYDNSANLSSAELYDPSTGTWSSAGNMNVARSGHASITALLPTSEVMVTGGISEAGGMQTYTSITELFDPATNTWSVTGSLSNARGNHTATLMPNGRIIVIGGTGIDSTVPMRTEIY